MSIFDIRKKKSDLLKASLIRPMPLKLRQIDYDTLRQAVTAYTSTGNQWQLQTLYRELAIDATWQYSLMHRKEKLQAIELYIFRAEYYSGGHYKTPLSRKLKELIYTIHDALFYGWVCIQINDWQTLDFDVIPPENVNPQKKEFYPSMYSKDKAIKLNELPYSNQVIIQEEGLGLMLYAAPYLIYKRNALADYAQFAELYGTPIQELTYNGNDPAKLQQLKQLLDEGGNAQRRIMIPDVEVKMHNPLSSANVEVYTKLLDYTDNQIVKLILGQNMTTTDGSSYAQARVHKNVEAVIILSDLRYIADFLNQKIKPHTLKDNEKYGFDGRI